MEGGGELAYKARVVVKPLTKVRSGSGKRVGSIGSAGSTIWHACRAGARGAVTRGRRQGALGGLV
jgi:hypothetical protein